MTYKQLTERITVFIEPLDESGCYEAKIRGFTPDDTMLSFDLELSGCYTQQVMMDTIAAELEEILQSKYHYEVDDSVDQEILLHDGGNFNESD